MKNKKDNVDNHSLEDSIDFTAKELPFSDQTEIGEIFGNMDDDSENDKGMSNIDFNARLRDSEASACVIIDELKALGILPSSVSITRLKKRLSVSLEGKGREEKVKIASASRGADLDGRSGGMPNPFKPRGQE